MRHYTSPYLDLPLRTLEQARADLGITRMCECGRPLNDHCTIYCRKCGGVISYPYAYPGKPYEPVTFIREGLCDSCRPWKDEVLKKQQEAETCAAY